MMRRRLLLASAPALVLVGCASPPAKYYRLAVIPGVTYGTTQSVRIRTISVPEYLGQTGIAAFAPNYQFSVFPNDLWAEPLGAMLQSTLVQELSQRLPEALVTGEGAVGTPADLRVEINVLRFDPDPSGRIVFQAQLAVRRLEDNTVVATRPVQSNVAPAGTDVLDIVAAMSTIWGGMADQVAAVVQAG